MFDGLGIFTVLLTISFIMFAPLLLTGIIGVLIANLLGFAGWTWWGFIILFYIVTLMIIIDYKTFGT